EEREADEEQRRSRKEPDRRAPVRRELRIAEAHGDEVRAPDEDDRGERGERPRVRPGCGRRRSGRALYLSQTRSPKKKSWPEAMVRVDCDCRSSTKNPPDPTYATRLPS